MKENWQKITESSSLHDHLEQMSTRELLEAINEEDKKVALAVEEVIPAIEIFVAACYDRFKDGGRLFYLGAGTSGRLGVVDASEIPPTFGYPHDRVIGLIAGGDGAIRKAVEFAEDDKELGWLNLEEYGVNEMDAVVGIASSGTTPYVLGAILKCRENNVLTAGITNNPDSPLAKSVEHPLVAEVGPEFVTGSTRMKGGTSQKLILNMISTSLMIKMGRVQGNKMIHMQLSNNKLVDRAVKMLMSSLGISRQESERLIDRHGSVHDAIQAYRSA